MPPLKLRVAIPSERPALEALQRRASLEQPAYRAALLAHPELIELPATQIAHGQVFIAELDAELATLAGFAVLLPRPDGDVELDGLFVDPTLWRRGIGRALVNHCCNIARSTGARSLHVTANPHAEAFYLSCHFLKIGTTPTRFDTALLMKRNLWESP